MFYDKNNLIIGILIGLAVPFVGYAVLLMVYEQLEVWGLVSSAGLTSGFRTRTVGMLSICLNLIPFQLYKRRKFEASMRGVLLATLVYAFAWLIYYGSQLM